MLLSWERREGRPIRHGRVERSARTGGLLAVKCTLVLETVLSFAGGFRIEGLDRLRFQREGSPGLTVGAPMTSGCTGEAEEGNPRNHPRSACPSLGLLTHVARATGSRRRKASSRWMAKFVSRSPSLHGKKRSRGGFTRARGSRPVDLVLARGESSRGTEREEGCGLRRAARIEARECARTSLCFELQKSTGDHCWPHRSSSTGS